MKNFQAALGDFIGLVRMLRGDAVETRNEFVDARVVFHGAGTERIHSEVDRVIPGRKAREVAHDFDFTDLGQARDAFGAKVLAELGGSICSRNIEWRKFERALAGRGFFENQTLVLRSVARGFADLAVHRGFSKTRRNAAAKRSISARGVVSVTQTRAVF